MNRRGRAWASAVLLVLLGMVSVLGPTVSRAFADPALPSPSVQLRPAWKTGETASLVMEHRRKEVSADGTKEGHAETRIALTVLSWGEGGGVLQWTVSATKVEAAAKGSLADRLASLQRGLELRIRVDAWGLPAALVNLEEVVAFYEGKADKARAICDDLNVDDDARRRILEELVRLRDAQTVEVVALTDARNYLSPLSRRFPREGSESFDAWVPSPFELQERVLASGQQSMHVSSQGRTASVTWSQAVSETLRAEEKSASPERAAWSETAAAEVDVASGWPKSVTLTRHLARDEHEFEETWTFRRR